MASRLQHGAASIAAVGLNAPMPTLTRRRDRHRAHCWRVLELREVGRDLSHRLKGCILTSNASETFGSR
jgi:hypothetical protein